MSESTSAERSLAQAREIDKCCDLFEQAWKDVFATNAARPVLEAWLPKVPPAEQTAWLFGLLPIELFHRVKAGEQPVSEEYVGRFGGLDAAWVSELIEVELAGLARAKPTGIADTLPPISTLHPGQRVGGRHSTNGFSIPNYELLGELGRGAMGVVYKAQQLTLGRTVALKMIRASDDASAEELSRFRSEGSAIARLQHPNIVQIYEFGEHAGRPYFSLEFIDGGTLAQKIAGVPQPPRDAARLVETLARAIHQAHAAGIVHRDLKPANVLMTSDGVPKITDFGLAKQTVTDHAATRSGTLLGTPQYMAPEQAACDSATVGPPADIYALGAILYEMLAGRPPFQASGLSELLHQIRVEEPTSPRELKRTVPRDLETICLKCLQKEPEKRYTSAALLADDLCRFLADRPIQARPVSTLERGWSWCRRNPSVAIPSVSLAVLLVVVSVGSLIAASKFKKISDIAEIRALDTKLELGRSLVNEARMLRRGQRVGQHTEAMAKLCEARDTFLELARRGYQVSAADWFELRSEAASAQLVPDLLEVARWKRESDQLWPVDGDIENRRYILFPGGGPQAEIRRIGTGELLYTIAAPKGCTFTHGMFSGQGNHLVLYSSPDEQMHFWAVSNEPKHIASYPRPVHWRTMSDDGLTYASADQNLLTRVMHVADGKVLAETNLGIPAYLAPFHPTFPWVALQNDKRLLVYNYELRKPVWQRELPFKVMRSAWSQDGRVFVTSGVSTLQWFAAHTGEPMQSIDNFDAQGLGPLPLSRAGMIGSVDWSGSLRLYNLHTGRQLFKSAIQFPDYPRTLGAQERITPGFAGTDYAVLQPKRSRLTEFGDGATEYATLNAKGDLLAVAHDPGECKLHHLPSGEMLAALPISWGRFPAGFDLHNQAFWLYGNGSANKIKLEWLDTHGSQVRLQPSGLKIASSTRDTWSSDRLGQRIAAPNFGDGAIIYQLSDDDTAPQSVHTPPQDDVRHASLSSDGRWLVSGSHVNGKVAVYNAADGSHIQDLVTSGGGWGTFSPNNRWLAVGKFTGGIELFSVDGWQHRGSLPGQKAAFSPDGKLVAVDNGMSTVSFFAMATLREVGQLEIQDQARVWPKFFTPDGAGLIACTVEDRRLLYFDLAGLRGDLRGLKLDWDWPTPAPEPAKPTPIPRVEIVTSPATN